MSKLWWLPAVAAGVFLLGAAFFFALHLASNEPVPLQRARLCWRWAVVVALGSFDFWIFSRIFEGLRALW